MTLRCFTLCTAVVLIASLAQPACAQRRYPVALGDPYVQHMSGAGTRRLVLYSPSGSGSEQRPSVWKYVGLGALGGAALAGAGLALDGSADEATLAALIIPMIILTSATAGALVGWAIYAIRY